MSCINKAKRFIKCFTKWGHGTLNLTPSLTLTRYHWDGWDGDCLVRVSRSMHIGIVWLCFQSDFKIYSRNWEYPETEKFLNEDV